MNGLIKLYCWGVGLQENSLKGIINNGRLPANHDAYRAMWGSLIINMGYRPKAKAETHYQQTCHAC